MRNDAMGLFWEDRPPEPKVKKEKIKRTPPDPVWLRHDYLPNLEEARKCYFDEYTDAELHNAMIQGELLEFDIEAYPNYLLIGFQGFTSGKFLIFERVQIGNDLVLDIDIPKLRWVMENFTTVGFNNYEFDNLLIRMVVHGKSLKEIGRAMELIFDEKLPAFKVAQHFKLHDKKIGFQIAPCVDLMNVSPRQASLKKYAARLHIEQIQDLPINPKLWLTFDHMQIIRWYWGNDIKSNVILHNALKSEINLRYKMGAKYGLNLLHRSDAQIAEDIFISEYKRITGAKYVVKPNVDDYAGKVFKYQPPAFIRFKTKTMQEVFETICTAGFNVQHNGYVKCEAMDSMVFVIGDTPYKMGIGGLHSQEKSRYFVATNGWKLKDSDVTSYYPNLILNAGLYPTSFGAIFLKIYEILKDTRVKDKAKQKMLEKQGIYTGKEYEDAHTGNGSGKIVINGSFGKLGSPGSALYAPHLLIQTTVTGQLSLLMLIEELELNGIKVISANTDGIVKYYREDQESLINHIIRKWEVQTGLELESTQYQGIFSRDVNNYFAIKENGKIKGTGIFNEANLQLDPKYEICTIAAMEYLAKGIPVETTVNECHDIRNFVMLKASNFGAVCDGHYLGKTVRYYKSNKENLPEIVVANSGNRVAMSENTVPCQLLPTSIPEDLDREWYITESYRVLRDVGWEM